MPNKTKSKRILAVKIKRMIEIGPDTSYMGEYAQRPASQFSIDRAHSEDCASVESNHRQTVDALERIIGHLDVIRRSPEVADSPDSTEWEGLDEAMDILVDLQTEAMECDCGERGDMGRNEYRYFNPSFNYVDKQDKPLDGLTPQDVRKYTRQDYERMERLQAGDWCYIGIRAEAEISIPTGTYLSFSRGGEQILLSQTITSGGLYGIESDSEREYLESIGKEELANLKTQLLALGFSRRAISQAFKNVEEASE